MAKLVFNIMAICGAAAFSGVMLSVGITLGGYWKSLSETDFLNWFANNNQFVAQSIPAVFLLVFIGLAGSIWYSWGTPSFIYWLAAGICILAVTGLTFGYFIPTNTAFASKAIEVSQVTAKLNQWITIHYFRIALAMIAAILGCIAIKI